MSDCKLSGAETVALFINLFCTKLFLVTPEDFISLLGSGAVLFVMFMFIAAFLLYWFYSSKNTSRIFDSKIFLVLLSSLLIIYGAIILSQFVYYTKTVWFVRSPLVFITLPFGVCMVFASKNGLKTLGKINGFFVPLLYLLIISLIFTSTKAFDLTYLTPIFGKGFLNMIKNGAFLFSSLFEFILLLLLPKITDAPHKKIGFISLAFSFVIFALVIGSYLLIGSSSKNLPLLYVIQSGFLGKSDSLFLILYAISGFLYLSTILNFSSTFFCSAFNIEDRKAVVYPLALILISLSGITFFNPNGQIFLKIFSSFLWIVPFLLPLIFILFRKEKSKKCLKK